MLSYDEIGIGKDTQQGECKQLASDDEYDEDACACAGCEDDVDESDVG